MGRFGMTTGRSYCGISGSPKRMEYTVQGDEVYLSAWLMAKSPALGSFRSRSRAGPAQWQFRAAAPASFGVHRGHAEAKICPPWYGNILDGSGVARRRRRQGVVSRVSRWARQLRGHQPGVLSPREASWS